jgi:hypothetical protein
LGNTVRERGSHVGSYVCRVRWRGNPFAPRVNTIRRRPSRTRRASSGVLGGVRHAHGEGRRARSAERPGLWLVGLGCVAIPPNFSGGAGN